MLEEATRHLVTIRDALRAIPWDAWPPEAPARVPPAPAIKAAVRWAVARVGDALAQARWAQG